MNYFQACISLFHVVLVAFKYVSKIFLNPSTQNSAFLFFYDSRELGTEIVVSLLRSARLKSYL